MVKVVLTHDYDGRQWRIIRVLVDMPKIHHVFFCVLYSHRDKDQVHVKVKLGGAL